MKKILISMLALVMALPVMAQYPDVPESVNRRAAREQAELAPIR